MTGKIFNEQDIMTAKEAAEMVDSAYLDLTNKTLKTELEEVQRELDKLIVSGTGKREMTIYKLSGITIKHLESRGYNVKYNSSGSSRGEDYYTIKF